MKLLTREKFKEEVFARSKGKCVFCDAIAVDAHHILDRKLFPDGGYYLSNGAAVCEDHHLECEYTVISVEEVREKAGITEYVLPPGFFQKVTYDKWGNLVNLDGTRCAGPIFEDTGCQKALKAKGKISLLSVIEDNPWMK